ncbi:MAG: hypothetical protein ACFFAH_10720 [Promethearchaeota archaeon]
MESEKLSMILYIIALILAGVGAILSLSAFYIQYGSILFVYCPIILIALGLLLKSLLKE